MSWWLSASRSSLEQEQLGEGAAGASEPLLQQVRPRYVTKTNRVECMVSFAEIVIVLDVNVLKLRKIYIFLIFVISPVRLTGKSVWGSCYSFLFYLVQFMEKYLMGRVVIVGCHGRILAVGFSNLLPG